MREIGPEIGLSCLVFIFDDRRHPMNEHHLTLPIPGAFEPFELREGVRQLDEVFDQIAGESDNVIQVHRTGILRRIWARWGLFIFIWVYGGVLQLPALSPWLPHQRLIGIAVGVFVVAFGLLPILIQPSLGKWFLIPGGVATRENGTLSRTGALCRYTADTSVLIVERMGGSWLATITSDDATFNKQLSRLEATALLAAWRCPALPPSTEALSTLI